MNSQSQAHKTPDTPAKETNDKNLAADAEAAAAKDEPMGSIAAAVPGSDKAAENGLEPGRKPGAEEPAVKKETAPTAGTEFPADKKASAKNKNAA